MSWISPTGFVDPTGTWTNEGNYYDGNLGTHGDGNVPADSWGQFLELTIGAYDCDKIRLYGYFPSALISKYDVDVYWLGAWHHIYEGPPDPGDTWTYFEHSLGGIYSVTAARVRLYNDYATEQNCGGWWFEFEFNEVAVGRSFGSIIG